MSYRSSITGKFISYSDWMFEHGLSRDKKGRYKKTSKPSEKKIREHYKPDKKPTSKKPEQKKQEQKKSKKKILTIEQALMREAESEAEFTYYEGEPLDYWAELEEQEIWEEVQGLDAADY